MKPKTLPARARRGPLDLRELRQHLEQTLSDPELKERINLARMGHPTARLAALGVIQQQIGTKASLIREIRRSLKEDRDAPENSWLRLSEAALTTLVLIDELEALGNAEAVPA